MKSFVVYINVVVPVIAISCEDILRGGSVKDFSKDDLRTLSSSSSQQLETCLPILGKDEMDVGKAEALWSTIKQKNNAVITFADDDTKKFATQKRHEKKLIQEIYGSIFDVPDERLKQLGWIISGIPPDDFYNITIPDIDMVSIFGSYRNLSMNQLTALKQSIDNQWSRKSPEQLTSYDLMALKQILCAFNDTEITLIHPDSYRDAAHELATLEDCPKSVLQQFARLAIDSSAFGNPAKWNSIQVASIGCVMTGLASANGIPADSMEGISPRMVKCLSTTFLQTMSEDQLQHFTTNAASAISSSQEDQLSSSQRSALKRAVTGLKYAKHNSAKKMHPGAIVWIVAGFFSVHYF